MNKKDNQKIVKCSFCGRDGNEVGSMIAGPDAYICDVCIGSSIDILKNNLAAINNTKNLDANLPIPETLKKSLDEYVIGQDRAKKTLAVAVYNHYKRISKKSTFFQLDDVEIEKSNVVFFGPTGCGKTLLAKTIARMLEVPFTIADATSLTEAGYVGDDVENIVVKLIQAADGDVEKAQKGIIYVDEVDKLARRGDSASITRDVGGEGVQQSLLKILEGTICKVPPQGGRKHPNGETVDVDTTNILFILGGAFVGLDKIIEKRHNINASIGFGADVKGQADENTDMSHMLDDVQPKDLHRFGLIPELVGRIPVRAALKELTREQLIQVLTQPRNAVTKQFIKMFGLEKIELEFTDDALKEIAKITIKDKTGARGLRSIIENRLLELQYNLPDHRESGVTKIVVNGEFIKGDADPIMLYESKDKNGDGAEN